MRLFIAIACLAIISNAQTDMDATAMCPEEIPYASNHDGFAYMICCSEDEDTCLDSDTATFGYCYIKGQGTTNAGTCTDFKYTGTAMCTIDAPYASRVPSIYPDHDMCCSEDIKPCNSDTATFGFCYKRLSGEPAKNCKDFEYTGSAVCVAEIPYASTHPAYPDHDMCCSEDLAVCDNDTAFFGFCYLTGTTPAAVCRDFDEEPRCQGSGAIAWTGKKCRDKCDYNEDQLQRCHDSCSNRCDDQCSCVTVDAAECMTTGNGWSGGKCLRQCNMNADAEDQCSGGCDENCMGCSCNEVEN